MSEVTTTAPVLSVENLRVRFQTETGIVKAVDDAEALAKTKVKAKVVGEVKGPKIVGFTYKNKTNQRKRWGHRQHYSTIEITGITGVPKG